MEIKVGQRLRELREQAQISQRELARRSGQSAGTVSMIELEKTSPSIATLKSLLDALQITFAEFFSPGAPVESTPFFTDAQLMEFRLGLIRYRHLSRSVVRDGPQLTLTTVQPGSDTSNVTHQPSDGEICVVVRGEITVTIDNETRVLKPNEGYVVRGGETRRIRNLSNAVAEYIFFSFAVGHS